MLKNMILCAFLLWAVSPELCAQCQSRCQSYNTFVGINAGLNNTTGDLNAFFGIFAGQANTKGRFNSFFGASSGYSNISGQNNSFFGHNAGYSNTEGNHNVYVGSNAGFTNNIGNYNAFFGSDAGRFNTTGYRNVFLGYSAGKNNKSGSFNAFLGQEAGLFNKTGEKNAYFGANAGRIGQESSHNAFFGFNAGTKNRANYNTFFGSGSGENNAEGDLNAFFGYRAGFSNTTGALNAFFGASSGILNETGELNAFFGHASGYLNTTGSENAFFGQNAGYHNQDGDENAFFGHESGFNNVDASFNTFLGAASGFRNTSGELNTFLGNRAGASNRTGSRNTYLGYRTGILNTSGSNNIFLGHEAGYNEKGSNKLYIANDSTSKPLIYGEFDNEILNVNGSLGIGIKNPERPIHLRATNAIFRIDRDRDDPGFAIVRYDEGFQNVWKSFYFYTRGDGPNDGKFIIADWGTQVAGPSTPRLVIANNGNVGIGNFLNSNPVQKLTVSGNTLANSYLVNSDRRYKKDIQNLSNTLSNLQKISGISYAYQTEKFEENQFSSERTIGLIAQEVQKVYPELVKKDATGYLSVNYDGLIPVLIEALKEQNQRIYKLEKQQQLAQYNSTGHSEALMLAQLYQNQPNPFDEVTTIKAYLPEQTKNATLYIYNMQGQTLKSITIQDKGEVAIEISGKALSAGMYLYALIVDNQEVDVKRMILK